MRRLLVALALWLVVGHAAAHGSVAARIARASRALHSRPNDAALYAERGALYALNHNWTQAAADFEEARAIDPSLEGIDVSLATALLELGEHERVVSLLDAALAGADSVDGYVVRARALAALGRHARAAADYSHALARGTPTPRLYRERAAAIAASGSVDEALASLDEGVARLGPIVTLIEPAIELELARGGHDAALALVDRLEPALRDTPQWQARRGDILARAGRHADADATYREALRAIDRHPRQSRALAELRAEISGKLRPQATGGTAAPSRWPWWLGALLIAAAVAWLARRRATASGTRRA